jgi:hypothetical protein
MKFTTHFELHSQTTRLVEGASHGPRHPAAYGILTLYDVLFQGTWTGPRPKHPLQITTRAPGGQISNLSCCRFTRRY